MCFSASASFITSAVLFSAGLYAVIKTLKYNRSYMPLALIPILFSIQQASEGMIWRCMTTSHGNMLHDSALLYMFFAFMVWPAYFPFCFYWIETSITRKKILSALTLLGLLLGMVIYIPMLMHEVPFNIALVKQSLAYSMTRTALSQYFYTASYALILLSSAFVSSNKEITRFALLALASFLISTTWFMYAFVSNWCFFAAVLSLYLVYIVSHLPRNIPVRA